MGCIAKSLFESNLQIPKFANEELYNK